jgi:GTPase SAR1 family protein
MNIDEKETTMIYRTEAQDFIDDLEKVARTKTEFANRIGSIADALAQAEKEGGHASGRLALDTDIEQLNVLGSNLQEGAFRLLVLGDMKRGKSTFLNTLIGENLLPRNVTPCTALLTTVRYGLDKKVTVYFTDGRQPDQLSFEEFKQRYTIDPQEAKRFEEQGTQAFPNVDYALVEYPLPLLEKGVEIVDSPGLNDTEERNARVLNYIKNCHVILFVLSATQQVTLAERRYLENYIKDRGLTIFFLINRWDEIKESLTDSEDPYELRAAEDNVRNVFRTNLAEYCVVDGKDLYNERMFEISSLNALRLRIKGLPMAGTGFPEFMGALNNFLTQDRARSELRQAKTATRQVYGHVHEAIERRLPLLDRSIEELKANIKAVEPEFHQLLGIRDAFVEEIRATGDRQADTLATSFYDYISNLHQTFEADFTRYQPELKFMDFMRKGKRQQFEASLKEAFDRYLNDQVAAWSRTAEQSQTQIFTQLASRAVQYAVSYQQVTDAIAEKVTGSTQVSSRPAAIQDRSPGWARWAAGVASFATGDFVGAGMAASGAFNWKNVLVNITGLIIANLAVAVFLHAALTPVGGLIVTAIMGATQAQIQRKKFLALAKQELVKVLPQIAQQQSAGVRQSVKNSFAAYEAEVVKRMNQDIQAQKAELDNLLEQKQLHEISRDAEIKRLTSLDSTIFAQWHSLEDSYDHLLAVRV